MCDPVSIGMIVAGTAMSAHGSSKQRKAQERAQRAQAQAISKADERRSGANIQQQQNIMDSLKIFNPEAIEKTRGEEEERITSAITQNMDTLATDPRMTQKISGEITSNDRYLSEKARQQKELFDNSRILASLTGKTMSTGPAMQLLSMGFGRDALKAGTLAAQMDRLAGLDQNKIATAGMVRPTPGADFAKALGGQLITAGMGRAAAGLTGPSAVTPPDAATQKLIVGTNHSNIFSNPPGIPANTNTGRAFLNPNFP